MNRSTFALAACLLLCLASLGLTVAGTGEASAGVILFGVFAILFALDRPGSADRSQ